MIKLRAQALSDTNLLLDQNQQGDYHGNYLSNICFSIGFFCLRRKPRTARQLFLKIRTCLN